MCVSALMKIGKSEKGREATTVNGNDAEHRPTHIFLWHTYMCILNLVDVYLA